MKSLAQPILVISSFPRGSEIHGQATVGVASYTKNLLLALHHPQTTVLAEMLPDCPTQISDHGIDVRRVWERNNPLSMIRLAFAAIKHPAKIVLVEFEFAMFGKATILPWVILMLFILRLCGKRIVISMHQVPNDFGELSGHLDIPQISHRASIYNFILQILYWFILVLSHTVVVFDDVFKRRLGNHQKVVVIAHGIEEPIHTEKKNGSEFLILCFGYLAWYKGSDWIIDAVSKIKTKKPIKLIMAGGANPQRMNFAFYRDYIKNIEDRAKESNGKIVITGYVPEDRISEYFGNADVILLPYRTLMSASGPMAIAARFGKPILASKALEPVFNSSDLVFSMNETSLMKKLDEFMTKDNVRKKAMDFSKNLAKEHSFTKIADMWRTVLQ